MSEENRIPVNRGRNFWYAVGWMALGGLFGLVLLAAFMAYGQPELLLELMNLRYCG